MSKKLSAEDRLLRECARFPLATEPNRVIAEILREGINWISFLRSAIPHGVLPLAEAALAENADLVPEATRSQLRRHAERVRLRNAMLTEELRKVLRLFETHGIRAITFKGPSLALLAYGKLQLREFHDLDVFLPPEDVKKARQLLHSRDYTALEFVRGEPQRVPAEREREELGFTDRSGQIVFELHQDLAPQEFSFVLPFNAAWSRQQSVNGLSTFGDEDLLCFLCVHGSKHGWRRLGWLCDIAAFVQTRSAIDWAGVLARAEELRCRRKLFIGLLLAREVLGCSLPPDVESRARKAWGVRQVVQIAKAAIFQPAETRTVGNFAREFFLQFVSSENGRGRTRILQLYRDKFTKADLQRMAIPLSHMSARSAQVLGRLRRSVNKLS